RQGRGVVRTFFFQAEDGIRGRTVTGVQTCALPILALIDHAEAWQGLRDLSGPSRRCRGPSGRRDPAGRGLYREAGHLCEYRRPRSEERRVGKECRGRWERSAE